MRSSKQWKVSRIKTNNPLFEVVSDAYQAFACEKPSTLGVCKQCCMDRHIEKDFLVPAIGDLPDDYVREWFFAAVADDFNHSVWMYLLPRVLELLAIGKDVSVIGIEVSLSRFPTGDASYWTAPQMEVLLRFQRLYLESGRFSEGSLLDDVICMFANASFPIDGILTDIWRWSDERLVTQLWTDWCEWTINNEIWITTFWENEFNEKVWSWYTSPEIYSRLLTISQNSELSNVLATRAKELAEVVRTASASKT